MEKSQFDLIVNNLLTLKPKHDILKRQEAAIRNGRRAPEPQEDSLRLAPRDQFKTCEDCGLVVKNRHVEISVQGLSTDYPRWIRHCLACDEKITISPRKNMRKNK
jgi:hypothetical protein